MDEKDKRGFTVLVGSSHPELARLILSQLPARECAARVFSKSCHETSVEIKESVRNREVFIVQTATHNVNSDIVELLIMIYACKTSAARKITVVMPYMPYTRQFKFQKRGPIVSKLLANMLQKAGASRVITVDLCSREVHGFFSIPLDNVHASWCIVAYIKDKVANYKNAVMVAKKPTVVQKATSLAEKLQISVAMFHGSEAHCRSENNQSDSSSDHWCRKDDACMILSGDVGGRIGILVDDVLDDIESFICAADILSRRGAYRVIVLATHGVFSPGAPLQLENSSIDEVFVTNTVPHEMQKIQCPKIKTIDISPILSEAIRRTFNRESLSRLMSEVGIRG